MKKMVFLVLLALGYVIFIQLSQHYIVKTSREESLMRSQLTAAKNCHAELLAINNRLCLRDRICSFAKDNLGMVIPTTRDTLALNSVTYIKETKNDKQNIVYSLIDYITPNAQALTEQNSGHAE